MEQLIFQPISSGTWISFHNKKTCSCCGFYYFASNCFNYCPNCGSVMIKKLVVHSDMEEVKK